jgi:hypothetical protein
MGVLLTKPLDLGLPSWVVVVAVVAPSTMVGRYDAYVPGRQLSVLFLKKYPLQRRGYTPAVAFWILPVRSTSVALKPHSLHRNFF